MSGTPPPNYNPNDSLLSGGDTAKIIPVQGGGFMPGGNYNADVSLLSGGEDAKILPVQGGGKPPTAAEQKAASIKLLEVGERLKRMQALEKEIEQLTKEPVGPDTEAKLAKLREKLAAAPANAKVAAEASAAAITAQLSKNHKEYASLVEEIAKLQAQPKSEERDAKLKELHRKFDRLPPLSTIEEANETNNFGDNENDGLPHINDLDVYVLAEGEDLPSLEQLSIIAQEDAKERKEKEEGAKQLEVPCPAPESYDVEDLAENFEHSDEAVDSKVKEVIRLVSREFYIRVPKRKSAGEKEDDDILADWKAGVFTEEEADFLNTMGLSPKLLYSSFYCHEKDWQEELAEFLYYLSVYTCYPASSLVLRGECQRVREFLFIVESNLKAEKLRKLAEKPVPVAGPITLPDLEKGEDEEEEEEGEEEGEEGAENSKHLASIQDRLKKLNVDDVEKKAERKTIAKKITNFFKGFFKKKPAKENAEEDILNVLDDLNDKGVLVAEPNEETKKKIAANKKVQKDKELEAAFQVFLRRLPPEYKYMDLELLKEEYLATLPQ